MLLFLAVNAHHIFIAAIAESYQRVNPLTIHFSGEMLENLIRLSKDIFVIAVKISAPVMAVLLFTNVAMGVVARTVPQMNIFIVSFPLQISIGLLFIGVSAPLFVKLVQRFFLGLPGEIGMLLRLL
jgi:flagellar biosynthetic protein FliR